VISVNNRNRRATHVALELAAGWILPFEWSQVLHLCDNPPCCNPAHLKIDTQQGNTEDRDARGRQARLRGERNGQAKFHQQDADGIRLLYEAGGISQRVLARQSGINQARISDIVRGKTWIAERRESRMDTFKTIVVAIVAVLGMVGTASAEGAWVLWGIGGDAERTYSKSANAAFDTRDQPLDSGAVLWFPAGAEKDGKQRYQYIRLECWPDTVKP
jgi:Helix-turn-helix